MTEAAKGAAALVLACLIWGLSPLFYKLLSDVPPGEVLAHRTLWSLVFFLLVLMVQGRMADLVQAFGSRTRAATLLLSGCMISCNWFLFIFAVQIGQTTQSSLGYYIFPLVAVLLGRFFFAERLTILQATAIFLAGAAVLLLSVGLGVFPLISLFLAITFGLYGVIKKRLVLGPVVSVTGEVLLLAPFAVGWLIWAELSWSHGAEGAVLGRDWAASLTLMVSGPLTAVPLMLFSYASRRITLASLGVIQYLNPTLQFLCAVFAFGEVFTSWHAVAFALIWTALALYSMAGLAQERAVRRCARRSSTEAQTSK